MEDQLLEILSAEEEYWRQRGRLQWTLQGDANTKFFQACANGRKRQCAIMSLATDNGIVADKEEIKELIYSFYINLMGTEEPRFLQLQEGIWAQDQKVSDEENENLLRSFSQEELDEVLKKTKVDTSLGPDGFPVVFYKCCWPWIKAQVLHILNEFALGIVDIARLNFGILSLIPKVPRADNIQQFRPIALINVIFKIVAKAYAMRLSPVAHRIISLSQTSFIKGRLIHDDPLALHEIIHELKVKKMEAVLLKLDFEKAYDKVNWQSLREVLIMKGFDTAHVHRIMQLVSGGQTTISINGEVGPYFRNKRGVRQGDPISPLLFDFVGDALDAILSRARAAGHIQGAVPHLIPGGVSHFQYADDTMILIQNLPDSIRNLKFLLICFELMSRMKINFHKSEVIVMGANP
jgi:hypothetical protein